MLNTLLLAPPLRRRLLQVRIGLRFTTCVIFNTNRVLTRFLITCYAALWIFIIELGTVEAAIDLEIHRDRKWVDLSAARVTVQPRWGETVSRSVNI